MEYLWWGLGGLVLLWFMRMHFRVINDPASKLGNQAANMGWRVSGSREDGAFKNMKVKKFDVEAMISFREKKVFLIDPPVEQPFNDFVALERYLEKTKIIFDLSQRMGAMRDPPPPQLRPVPTISDAQLEEARNYHAALDALTAECTAFATESGIYKPHTWPVELHAEAIVYSACYCAKYGSRHQFHNSIWNTFRASVENRMVAIMRPPEPRREPVGDRFVSYTTPYYGYLESREKLAPPRWEDRSALVERLVADLGGYEQHEGQFATYFDDLVRRAEKEVLSKVWLAFR